jgi:hypothetical protein
MNKIHENLTDEELAAMGQLTLFSKAQVKETGEFVTVTGKSGDRYRVFISGNNMRHEWYDKDELEIREGK